MTDSKPLLATCLRNLGVDTSLLTGGSLAVFSPIDGACIARMKTASAEDVETTISSAVDAFRKWRNVPAPIRGELVRRFGNVLREHKADLGQLVSLEVGKILQEGLGEVQEMIDICDFAVGLSRQLHGLTIVSERPQHVMRENWHPIGPVGVISAFNFPVAVWSWNTALAIVCGDSVIWKPSEKAPLAALACQALFERAAEGMEDVPDCLTQILIGDASVSMRLVEDTHVPVISATGSCAMGRIVGSKVAARFGRSILELGGNNAIIVAPTADLEMATLAIVFGAVGTAGQRCTTTRRLFVHTSIYSELVAKLKKVYTGITVGNPLEEGVLVGPLIDEAAFEQMQSVLRHFTSSGATVHGGERFDAGLDDAWYVRPALIELPDDISNVSEETFAPILYVSSYVDLEDAIARNNDVPQGLSSAIFTNDVREAEQFTSAVGSDCGIANVNIGTSGAEIGGAFGGEKETGGGRESGSDAWKAYMRRSTSTVNYGAELPLAQGIRFDI